MEGVSRFGVSIPPELLEKFDKIIETEGYDSRSEAIRDMIRGYIVKRQWISGEEDAVCTVSLVYDHTKRGIAEKITDVEHQHIEEIVTTSHVHLDHENCLEVIIIKGNSEKIRDFARYILSIKVIKHGDFIIVSTGKGIE